MAFLDSILPILSAVRAIPGEQFGLRPITIAAVVEIWTGDGPGLGTRYEDEIPIVEANNQPPRIRILTEEEIAVGSLPRGTLEVGPITPEFSGGGTPLSVLTGEDLAKGTLLHFRLRGPGIAGRYTKVSLRTDRALRYMMQVRPAEQEFP